MILNEPSSRVLATLYAETEAQPQRDIATPQ